MARRIRPDRLSGELLVKAAKFHGSRDQGSSAEKESGKPRLWAVDATAGLGQDSLLLAAAGYRVDLCEKNPDTAQLLQEILRQAAGMPELQDAAERLCFHQTDSIAYLQSLAAEGRAPDLVYLDPMFPARRKSSKVKKKLQLLQAVEDPCDDAGAKALLEAAVKAGPRRIVVKRPAHGPYLAGRKPSYSIMGKVIRYDCLVLRT